MMRAGLGVEFFEFSLSSILHVGCWAENLVICVADNVIYKLGTDCSMEY
jgi:hypothetical protein